MNTTPRRWLWLGSLLVGAAAVAVPVAVFATGHPAPEPPSARVVRWRDDIAYLARELPLVRVDGLGPVSRAAWDSAAARLETEVPQLTDGQLLVRLARMVALLHDDETSLEFPPGPIYALDAQWFGPGLYLLTVPDSDRSLLGAQVLAVDGHPIAQVMADIGSVIDYQDPGVLEVTETGYLDDASILYWLGITNSATSAAFTLRTTAGGQQTVLFKAAGSGTIVAPDLLFSFVPGVAHVPLPLYLHDAAVPYWMDVLAGQHAVYLKYNECLDTSGFQQLAARAIAVLKQNPDYRLIVDLRDNVGGFTGPFQSLVKALAADPAIDRRGRIFGLVNQFTFSAARDDAVLLSQENAALIGVPPGDPIDEYGDKGAFTLPGSDITVDYTQRIVNSTGRPQGTPDIMVSPTLGQVLDGADPVLAEALSYG
jgi:hypothetical protein